MTSQLHFSLPTFEEFMEAEGRAIRRLAFSLSFPPAALPGAAYCAWVRSQNAALGCFKDRFFAKLKNEILGERGRHSVPADQWPTGIDEEALDVAAVEQEEIERWRIDDFEFTEGEAERLASLEEDTKAVAERLGVSRRRAQQKRHEVIVKMTSQLALW